MERPTFLLELAGRQFQRNIVNIGFVNIGCVNIGFVNIGSSLLDEVLEVGLLH